jgi:hypothetical protein
MGISGSHRQEQRGLKTGHPAMPDHVAATQKISPDLCDGIAEQKHADMSTAVEFAAVLSFTKHGVMWGQRETSDISCVSSSTAGVVAGASASPAHKPSTICAHVPFTGHTHSSTHRSAHPGVRQAGCVVWWWGCVLVLRRSRDRHAGPVISPEDMRHCITAATSYCWMCSQHGGTAHKGLHALPSIAAAGCCWSLLSGLHPLTVCPLLRPK